MSAAVQRDEDPERRGISFEFFPPRTMEASFRLSEAVRLLAPLAPDFVSVTYGAGGTTRQLTHEAVEAISRHYGLNVAAHLTCVDATREETLAIARAYAEAGVREIVALRGDPPKGAAGFTPHPEGFADSAELVAALKEAGQFHIRVGAYPDPHPDARDEHSDINWLKRKFEAGADSAITQFFFEPETFLRFRDRCAAAGISGPIIPGILPIENWSGVKRFAARCQTPVPGWLDEAFEQAEREGQAERLAVSLCAEMCSKLRTEGVDAFHFYTLNKPDLTRQVCAALGIQPRAALSEVA
ncbi:MAG: methylenetetrahydrofolate reductase [NAD(P)H] [Rhodobacteraceae bacterium]|nr:methylenetetrahydrofolate reductase [NAD(P)H] [Paracoccaceae bacterium]